MIVADGLPRHGPTREREGSKRVTIADDMQKMMAAQSMMTQELSGAAVYHDLGYNRRQDGR
jgi:hypothetical protein